MKKKYKTLRFRKTGEESFSEDVFRLARLAATKKVGTKYFRHDTHLTDYAILITNDDKLIESIETLLASHQQSQGEG